MTQHYYYVKCGDSIRCEKADSPFDACRQAYGSISDCMLVKDLGTRTPKYFSQKKKDKLRSEKINWTTPKGKLIDLTKTDMSAVATICPRCKQYVRVFYSYTQRKRIFEDHNNLKNKTCSMSYTDGVEDAVEPI